MIADAQSAKWQARYGRDPTDQQRAWLSGEQGTYGHCHEGDQAQRAGPADEPPGHVREGKGNLRPAEAAGASCVYNLFCKITINLRLAQVPREQASSSSSSLVLSVQSSTAPASRRGGCAHGRLPCAIRAPADAPSLGTLGPAAAAGPRSPSPSRTWSGGSSAGPAR